ncbi:MAG: ATP-binding protein [Nitrospinae bacterium]|nr:ATP-binding protein [Nitrospinota bacterium]
MEKGQFILNKESILFSPEAMKGKSEDLNNPTLLFTLPSDKFLTILKEVKEHKSLGNKEKFLKEVFNLPLDELVTISRGISYYKLLLFQKALFSILNNWKITKKVKIDKYEEQISPVEYTAFEIEYGIKEDAIEEGTILLISPDNKKLVVEFMEYGMEIDKKIPMAKLTCEKDRKVWLEGLIREIDDWMLKNSYFKGKKIKPDGTFLDIKKGKYSWDDIILDETIKNEIKRNITDYFELKEIYNKNNLPSKRGILCYGMPGTGKTLLGKVLASQVDSTFIWVTASNVPNASNVFELFRVCV